MDFGCSFIAQEIILMETKMRQRDLEKRALQIAQMPSKKSKKLFGLVSLVTGIGFKTK